MKVKAIINFNDLQEGIHRVAGKSEWECSKERADYLLKHNAIEIIEEIKEAKIEAGITPEAQKKLGEIVYNEIKKSVKEEKPKTSKKKKSNKK